MPALAETEPRGEPPPTINPRSTPPSESIAIAETVRTFLLSLSLLLLLPGTASARVQSSIAHSQPGLTIRTRTVYCRITGRAVADLRAQMNRRCLLDYFTGKRHKPAPIKIARWFWRDS